MIITGRVYRRIEKEKAYQYYIKDAILEMQSKNQIHKSIKDQTADQAGQWKNNQIIVPIHEQKNTYIVKTDENQTEYQDGKQMVSKGEVVPIAGNVLVISEKEGNQSSGKISGCRGALRTSNRREIPVSLIVFLIMRPVEFSTLCGQSRYRFLNSGKVSLSG